MSIQCANCREFIYKGKKFNARKEWSGRDYLGIKIWRFFFKCPMCSVEITFLTDPKNSNYEVERNAIRNYEAWRQEEKAEEILQSQQQQLEADALAAVEAKSRSNRLETEVMDAIEDVLERNAAAEKMNAVDSLIEGMDEMRATAQRLLDIEVEEEAELAWIKHEQMVMDRLADEQYRAESAGSFFVVEEFAPISLQDKPQNLIVRKRKREEPSASDLTQLPVADESTVTKADPAARNSNPSGVNSLLANYDSDSDS